jgi:MFS family permease
MGPTVVARLFAGRLHYSWVVLGTMFLVMLATAGVRASPSVLIVPLQNAFGWDRATISAAVSVNIGLYGLIGPFGAAFMQTLGLKRTILIALSILACAVALSGFIDAKWQLFLTWGVLVGLGSGVTAGGLAATVANRWFVKNRGLAVGILTASNASGQLVFLPVLAAIAEGGHWRMVSWVVAAFAALLIPIVLLMLPESPRTIGLGPLGAEVEPEPVRRKNPVGMALNGLTTGMRSADFWLLAGSFAICGFSANGLVGTHLISYCMDNGIAPVAAASVVAGMGVFDLIGTTCSGWLSDRYNPRILLFWYYGLRGVQQLRSAQPGGVLGLLWPRFRRHRAADGDAGKPSVRPAGRADHRRLAAVRSSDRRGDRGGRRGMDPQHDGQLLRGVHNFRCRLPDRVADRAAGVAHEGAGRGGGLTSQRMVGFHQPLQPLGQYMRVDLRRRDVGVAQQQLQAAQIGAAGEQMRRERMAQHVG